MRDTATVLLLVRVPQGENEESTFEQLLVNMHDGMAGGQFACELVSYNQHIYFYVRAQNNMREFVEGNIYALYPDAEIFDSKEYVNAKILDKFQLATAELSLVRSDI